MYRWILSLGAVAASLAQATQPNIVFVLTDDQDIELGSLDYLNTVTSRIQQEGKQRSIFIQDTVNRTPALRMPHPRYTPINSRA